MPDFPSNSASSCHARVARVEAFPMVYPTVGRFKFFEGPRGQPAGRAAVLVKLTAENGTVGWGQSVPVPTWSYETLESAYSTVQRYLAPELIGCDPFDLEGIHERMDRLIRPSFSTGQPICKAGVDLALHDLGAKLAGVNVTQLWNRPTPQHLTLSWTLNPRSLAEVEGLIAQGHERGYRHFNVKVAPDLDFDVELCRQVKRLAPDGFLWADANGGYDEAAALQAAPRLADLGVAVLEQPLPANRLGGYKRMKQQGALPILMDEGIVSSVELWEFIQLGLLDGVAIKPARSAGLHEARKQIEMILNEGLLFLGSGLTDPDLALAGSLLLFGAYDLRYPAALNGPQFLDGSILKRPFQTVEGQLALPLGPGLGVEVDEAKIERYLVTAI